MLGASKLNYVLIILAMILNIVQAQEDNYEEEMRKFKGIYGNPNTNDQVKSDNLPYFIDFLNRNLERLPEELKTHFMNLKASLKIPDADTEVLVDGVPAQGGSWGGAFQPCEYAVSCETTRKIVWVFCQNITVTMFRARYSSEYRI